MKKLLLFLLAAAALACSDNTQKEAENMLEQAKSQFEQRQYDRALITIDSIRKVYPFVIDVRKQALKLHQAIELKRAQEELALADSALQVVIADYEQQRKEVEAAKRALRATPEQLTRFTKTRVLRDSLQTEFDVLCAKIRYIHKKQGEKGDTIE